MTPEQIAAEVLREWWAAVTDGQENGVVRLAAAIRAAEERGRLAGLDEAFAVVMTTPVYLLPCYLDRGQVAAAIARLKETPCSDQPVK